MTNSELAQAQRDDPALAPVIDWMEREVTRTPDDIRGLPLSFRTLWSQHDSLTLRAGVLVRCVNDSTQLVVPASLQRRPFELTHAGPLAAHLGPQRMLQQLQQNDIADWYRQCQSCATSKPPPCRPHAPMTKVITGAPMDLVAIDILSGVPVTPDGY